MLNRYGNMIVLNSKKIIIKANKHFNLADPD